MILGLGILALLIALGTLVRPNIVIPGIALATVFGLIWDAGGLWDAIGTFAILIAIFVLATIIDEYDSYRKHKKSE